MTVCIPFAFRSSLYSSLFWEDIQSTDLGESRGEAQECAGESDVDPEESGSGPGKEGDERERLSLNDAHAAVASPGSPVGYPPAPGSREKTQTQTQTQA
eukprot:CAMPEP_0173252162 /NCGR_PEP_ID=MMETSP1142-20121109/20563_1 /TAXON_ID=483371 /ORGANISM="non described non described, Strain CCMP2298" /LENGTH=98 /DNA_ID=CAMNT_0014185153 /DNA_START=174 /DNA_END=471 /DNA_ORIENTATION=-